MRLIDVFYGRKERFRTNVYSAATDLQQLAFTAVPNQMLPAPVADARAFPPAVKPGLYPVRSLAAAGIVKPKPLCYNNLYGASANP